MSSNIATQKRKMWGIEPMVRAVKAVRGRKIGLLKSSKLFSVPRATHWKKLA
jgi:hypothetical protein